MADLCDGGGANLRNSGVNFQELCVGFRPIRRQVLPHCLKSVSRMAIFFNGTFSNVKLDGKIRICAAAASD